MRAQIAMWLLIAATVGIAAVVTIPKMTSSASASASSAGAQITSESNSAYSAATAG